MILGSILRNWEAEPSKEAKAATVYAGAHRPPRLFSPKVRRALSLVSSAIRRRL